MRIVSWNILDGGGGRAALIAEQLERWQPSVVVLCEYRGTQPSQTLASHLSEMGLTPQRSTVATDHRAKNALLVASRWPLRLCENDKLHRVMTTIDLKPAEAT